MAMIRKNFYLTLEQHAILKAHEAITVSEHIRRAVDQYISGLRKNAATTSPSMKGAK